MDLASNALTVSAIVKKQLGPLLSPDEELLILKINEASQFIENYCGRKFKKQIYTEKYSGSGKQHLGLNQWPVTEVTAVTIGGTVQTSEEYEAILDSGILFCEYGWSAGNRNITVQYEAGYVLPKDATTDHPRTLPYDIEALCISIAAIKCRNIDSEGLKDRRIGDYSETFLEDLPDSIKGALDLIKTKR
jgi:hypothetical protein